MRWSNVLRIALLVVLVLIVGLVIKSYTEHRKSAGHLLYAIDTLQQDNPGLRLMDSALVTLSEAESNFRLYTVVYEKTFLQAFSNQLAVVSSLLDSVAQPLPGSDPRQLDLLIDKKAEMSDKVAQLKKSTDDMLTHSLKDEMINKLLNSVPPYNANRIKKEQVVRDTAKSDQAAPAKKGLFKRLGQAIANKGDTVKSQQVITVKTKDGKVMTEEEFEARQLRTILTDVNGYYKNVLRKQLEGRMQINAAEHSLAGTNITLLQDLKSLIQTLKSQSVEEDALSKSRAGLMAAGSVDTMKSYLVLLLVGVLLAVILALWIWYDNWRYDRKLQVERQKAEDAARARSVFLANMSHEIRTPLSSIVGFSEQLGHTPLENDQRELLRAVEVSADMLMQVVNDVLDFSKLESDYISIQKQPFGLYQTLSDVVNAMRIQAMDKDLDLQFSFEGNQQQQVQGDVFRLKQILVNLIGNAIKYTDTGSVTVKARLDKTQEQRATFVLTVEDTGPGISADMLPRIFERFYQARSPRVDIKGTGLGLAITKRLIELHNGQINVESEVNKGSRFTCNIPYETVSGPQTMVITQKDLEQMSSQELEGLYVLVADDQEMNLLLLKMILTRWKCRFDMARDGDTALALFRTNEYDLVLLDLQMPKMSGIDVVERIRAHADTRKAGVPVLAITADITRHDEESFRKAGFTDWLLKPFREKDIYKVVVKYLPSNRVLN